MRGLILAVVALAGCASALEPPAPACAVSAADRAWIDASLAAWRFSAQEITGVTMSRSFEAVFFDSACVLTSDNAFGAEPAEVVWRATPHAGTVTLPDGAEMPAIVTSFAGADETRAFFVMSTPSVWRAGGVSNDALGLETMMTAVLLHEGAHVAQSNSYGAAMSALAAAHHLPEDFNDDSIQARFGDNAEFAASVQRETDLWFAAADAPDDASARELAGQARALMRARQGRWFVGEDAYLADAEAIWLTFEGSGQWVGYQWLIHPAGGGAEIAVAMPNFARRSRWWSQDEGLGLALALDRFATMDWKRHAFGDGAFTLTQMLDAALAE